MKTAKIQVASAVAALAAMCAFAQADVSEFSKKVMISPASALVESGTTLTDFPVLVRLGSHISGFAYNDFKQSGADLLFTDSTGTTVYPYEVQVWDTTGVSLVWVKIPSLTSATEFAMWYGSTTAQVVNTPSDVWSEYLVVLHLDEDAQTFACADSTANGFAGTAFPNTLGHSSGGKVGGYRDNWAQSNDGNVGIQLPTMTAMGTGNNFTFTSWMNHPTGNPIAWDHILMCNDSYEDCNTGGGVLLMLNGGENRAQAAGYGTGWGYGAFTDYNLFSVDGTWDHFAFSCDGANVKFGKNGAWTITGTMGGTGVTERNKNLSIGALSNCVSGNNPWRGCFDEARIRLGTSSAEWIRAEHATMDSVSSLSYGTAASPGAVLPAFDGTPACARQANGTVRVTGALDSTCGATVYAEFNGTLRLSVGEIAAGGAIDHTFAAADFGATATMWTCRLVAVTSDGEVYGNCSGNPFLTGGEVSVAATADAYEHHLVAGSITVSRPATATQHDLSGTLTASGTAVNGTHYTAATSFTIPAGESSVAIAVTPIDLPEDDTDRVATFAVDASADYAASAATADVTIYHKVATRPVVTRAFSANGCIQVWVEDFTSNANDYILQFRNESGAWETYTKKEVGSNNPYTTHPFTPCLRGVDLAQRGVKTWRIATAESPSLWTEFAVDARFPLKGTPIGGVANGWANAFDGRVDSYYLAYSSWWNMWAGLDFGEKKQVARVAYLPNGSHGYLQFSDDPGFPNESTITHQLVDSEADPDASDWSRLHIVEFATPVSARYARYMCDVDGWFSVWELEFDEGLDVVNEDYETGHPTIVVPPSSGPTEIRRAYSKNGAAALVATLPAGQTRWTDTSLNVGEKRWYEVGGCRKMGARMRRLDRDPLDETTFLHGCELFATTNVGYVAGFEPVNLFDGNLATYASDDGDPNHGNPAIGVKFAERREAFVSKCRIYCHDEPWWLYQRMRACVVYGSNDDVDPVANAVAISQPLADSLGDIGGFYREWIDIPCDSTTAYKYVFIRQQADKFADDPWRGNAAEMRIYGWSVRDVAKGFAIVVR